MNKIILIYNELIVIPNSLWEIILCVKTIAIYIAMQKLKFEFVKPFQTRGCWTRALELFLVCFFLFSFLSHVAYEKDLFEGICCFGEKALKKDSEPLFCFPDHPIDYEGVFFSQQETKRKQSIWKSCCSACCFCFSRSSKAHFPLTKRPFVVKKSFSLTWR